MVLVSEINGIVPALAKLKPKRMPKPKESDRPAALLGTRFLGYLCCMRATISSPDGKKIMMTCPAHEPKDLTPCD